MKYVPAKSWAKKCLQRHMDVFPYCMIEWLCAEVSGMRHVSCQSVSQMKTDGPDLQARD